jgi:hypothetical protein
LVDWPIIVVCLEFGARLNLSKVVQFARVLLLDEFKPDSYKIVIGWLHNLSGLYLGQAIGEVTIYSFLPSSPHTPPHLTSHPHH